MDKDPLSPDSIINYHRSYDSKSVVPPVMSRQNLYHILMQIPAMLCVLKGPGHIFELINEPCRKLLDYRDLDGKEVVEALPELKEQGFLKILDTVYQTGQSYTGNELPVTLDNHKGRQTFFLNFHFQAFVDADDQVECILVFAYNVTEQVLSRNVIRESELKYRELIYGLPCAIYTCNAEGYIQLYNEAAVQLWGRKPNIGRDLWYSSLEIYKADGTLLPSDECPMAIALAEGRISNMEIVVRRPDHTERNVIPYPQPMYDKEGKITGAVNTLIDITGQVMARRQMEQTAEMVERLYMNAPAFICTLKGSEYVFELVNTEYQKLYGKRKLLGKKVIEALPELKGQGVIEQLDKVYQTGASWVTTEMLLYLSRDEGRKPEATYLNFSYQPMYSPNKEVNGILVFGYEVTEQVMARKKNEENLRIILESLPQITSASSADGSNIFFNKFFFEYSGLSREEASVNGWNSILHPRDIDGVLNYWDKCRSTGEDFYKVIRLKRKSDEVYRWHIAHLKALKDEKGVITQWIGSATDIHEQKIKEQNKDEFLSIASHEMKTPLTTAKAYLQLLELSIPKDNEKANVYIQKAILSVERLKDLISELLDVNKIQHGKLNFNFNVFDFDTMVDEAVEAVQYNSPHHQIIKTGRITLPVRGDKERLQQVIINLLSNAVKYSPDANKVFIDNSTENGEIKVSVKDNGIGIAPKNKEKIFERYFRVEGQDIHFQGLGIGLYISMEIIKRHQGEIWVESELKEGSTFYFCLPVIMK